MLQHGNDIGERSLSRKVTLQTSEGRSVTLYLFIYQ